MKMLELIKKVRRLGVRLSFMKMLGYESVFTCGYRTKGTNNAFLTLPYSKRYWYADPLAITYKKNTYVFMEAFDRKVHLGRIAYSRLTDNGWGDIHEVISEPFHMSFPTIFMLAGNMYMIPETSTAKKIVIYRCSCFPNRWEKMKDFFNGMSIVDSSIIYKEENFVTILSSICNPDNSLQAKFFKFDITISEGGENLNAIEDNDFNRRQQYSYFNRNAGGIIDNNELPLQKSTPAIYGYSVIFEDIEKLKQQLIEKGEFDEKGIIREITPSKIKIREDNYRIKPMGVHTYSVSENLEIIDIEYLDRKPKKRK